MISLEEKVVGTFVCETSDWSAEQMAEAINNIQAKSENKIVFSGVSFEHRHRECQLLIGAVADLTNSEIGNLIRAAKKEI